MVVPKKVFAHYVVGLTFNQTVEQWHHDIETAAAAAIDGFALNVGAQDTFTLTGLRHAYEAAATVTNFSLFLSFDFLASDGWNVDKLANFTSTFKDEPAQFKVDGKPFVSTFEGPAFSEPWKEVRKKVDGDIYFVPDWSSLAPEGVGKKLDVIDGAFSFDAWPGPGQTKMTVDEDERYVDNLDGKTYMAPVSPYFYTRLSALGKNWYSSSDSLWFDRWNQILEQKPDLVQIISWNDFGESHYIADTVETQVLPAARTFVDGLSHSAFRFVLPYYIAAYKAGTKQVPVPEAMGDGGVVGWYRTTPANISGCSDGGTSWGQLGSQSARFGTVDAVNAIAVSVNDATLRISVGSATKTLEVKGGQPPQFFQVPFAEFGGQGGKVKFEMEGITSEGPSISSECPDSDVINFNAAAVQVALPRTQNSNGGSGGPGGGSGGNGNGGGGQNGALSQGVSWIALLPALFFALAF